MIKISEEKKYTILCILKDLALHDRNFNNLEAIRIRKVGLKMDVHASRIDEALYEETNSLYEVLDKMNEFQDNTEKKFLYQQCLLLLMSDRDINEEEKDAMKQIQAALDIDNETHQRFYQWVQEGIEWEKRGEELVSEPISS